MIWASTPLAPVASLLVKFRSTTLFRARVEHQHVELNPSQGDKLMDTPILEAASQLVFYIFVEYAQMRGGWVQFTWDEDSALQAPIM
ncbi:hypothetical protein HUJ05_001055 [Dendroctonus ponderosae]|nr:hypothetical protein HUJ05_001055 [Dendroctonus ponderosae]